MNKSKRIQCLDIARTFAIMSVVLCHAVELIYPMNVKGWTSLGMASWLFRTCFFTIGRLGVPIFLFISGYLLLNKKIENDEGCIKFYKHNLIPLLVITYIWIVIYNIFISLFYSKRFDLSILVKEILFLEKVPVANMWYMPMIVGIYVAIPFVNKIIKNFSIKSLRIPMLIVFGIYFIIPNINAFMSTFKLKQYTTILDTSFLGGIYGLYIITGYLISKDYLKRIKYRWLVLISMFGFILACLMQIFIYTKSFQYNVWYNSALIFICTACLFEIFTRVDAKKINIKLMNICTDISRISLAIFFVHIIIEQILKKYIIAINISNPIKVLVLFAVSFCISILIIQILSKIKLIKRYVFFIKE